MADDEVSTLSKEIIELEKLLCDKRQRLESLLEKRKKDEIIPKGCKLLPVDITKYSRQVLCPNIGVLGQSMLKNGRVLIVGMGGLGCPAALYLAAAGVGKLTLVDYDVVEISNLHRQILYTEADVGQPKVLAASRRLMSLNNAIVIVPVAIHADSKSMVDLLNSNCYDVVLDCTDNLPTRYLLNDLCVLNRIPLVSGSALQMEGQLTVYNHLDAPCYRCLYPKPPPTDTVMSCGDFGVVGPVVGLIGVLQALETMRILIDQREPGLSKRMLHFDGYGPSFLNCKFKGRRADCEICGSAPTITKPIDYEIFCGSKADDKVHDINVLELKENVSVEEFFGRFDNSQNLLLDVRPALEFEMCHIPGSTNVPFSELQHNDLSKFVDITSFEAVYVMCRRGNDSQRAILIIKESAGSKPVFNIKGGLHAYAKKINSQFPIY